MKSITFLLGAGFSIPAKIGDRKVLNDKLKSITATNIVISTVSIAYFIPENSTYKNWSNSSERYFIEYFVQRYVNNNPDFDYEKFYDYCRDLYNHHSTSEELDLIHREYKEKVPYYEIDKLNSMSILLRTLDQLIDNLLYNDKKLFEGGIIDEYSNFLKILNELIKDGYQINIFTLNHDLLLEKILSTDISQIYDDGFQHEETPYYIKQGGFQIRIKYYNKVFNSNINIFKLHGSIDNYIINMSEPFDMVKIPKTLNILELYREKSNSEGVVEEHLWTLYKPSFLSGDDNKVRMYDSHQYYRDVFNEFILRLQQTEVLVCVGYGLMDVEINNKIFDNINPKTKILVVKPSKGNPEFYRNDSVIHFGDGKKLEHLDLSNITDLL